MASEIEKVQTETKIEELKAVDVTTLKDTCPVFDVGCPFAKISHEDTGKEYEKCPEFKNGCPFKDAKSMADIYSKLEEIPVFENGGHANNIVGMLKNIHNVSKDLKNEVGDCPVFDSGCPFKTVCSDGKPLVEKLELRRWTQILEGSVEQVRVEQVRKAVDLEIVEKSYGVELSKELKKGTKLVHREAENVHFVKNFVKGKVEKELYKMLLSVLYHVYRALEEESEKNKDHALFGAIHFPDELNRVAFIEEDLKYYFGEDWKDNVPISDAASKYVDRIKEISKDNPALLIAHHYTRYLGDLSGGQVLKKMARKAMQLPETGEGVCFYDFSLIEDARKFKKMYRARLDDMEMSKEVADRIVEEANYAFLLNIWVFQEIDRAAGYEVEMVKEHRVEELRPKEVVDACPFAKIAKTTPKETDNNTEVDQVASSSSQSQCSVHSPIIWGLAVAAVAVFVALVIAKGFN